MGNLPEWHLDSYEEPRNPRLEKAMWDWLSAKLDSEPKVYHLVAMDLVIGQKPKRRRGRPKGISPNKAALPEAVRELRRVKQLWREHYGKTKNIRKGALKFISSRYPQLSASQIQSEEDHTKSA